ncbi:MAG: hypothetical protein U0175_23295 [Caldilineaceae bacterium]
MVIHPGFSFVERIASILARRLHLFFDSIQPQRQQQKKPLSGIKSGIMALSKLNVSAEITYAIAEKHRKWKVILLWPNRKEEENRFVGVKKRRMLNLMLECKTSNSFEGVRRN